MKTILLLPIVALAAGCAATTGVIPIGGDTYSVMRRDNGPLASLGELKAAAYRDAAAHCGAMGKKPNIIRSNDVPRSFGQFPETEVQFNCV